MVGHILAFLLVRTRTDTLGLFYGAVMKPPLGASVENGRGEITDEHHSKTGRCQQAHNDS